MTRSTTPLTRGSPSSGSAAQNSSDSGDAEDATSKTDKAKQLAERALATLAEQLDAGASDQLTAYLKAMSRFHAYSTGNVFLILSQRPDATRVAGFHTWKKLGRSVKRGEKGIAIFAPMLLKARDDREKPSEQTQSDEKPYVRFRVVYVFDASQTEGEPLPEPSRVGGDPGWALARLESAVRASGITLAIVPDLGGAEGVSRGGGILLREGLDPAERFSVLVHEWAHEIMHQGMTTERPPKAVRETEAEAVAYVVGEAVGLDTGSASADYIRLYRGDAETLAASLDRIQKTACMIIEAVTQERDAENSKPAAAVRAHIDRRRR